MTNQSGETSLATLPRGKFRSLYLEITNVCNLRCPFCSEVKRPREFMPLDRFSLILAKIRGQARTLYFHVKGEPLLHPDLATMLHLAGEAGFQVRLTTNGSLLSACHEKMLEQTSLYRLNVSLHSLEAFPVAERPERLQSLLQAVVTLRADPRFRADYISLRLWNRPSTQADQSWLLSLENFFKRPPGSLSAALAQAPGTRLAPGLSLHLADPFSWPELAQQSTDHPDSGSKAPSLSQLAPFPASQPSAAQSSASQTSASQTRAVQPSAFCLGLRHQAAILVDGTVVPCCLDADGEINLGNLLNDDWDTILKRPRAQALYDGFSARKAVEPLCQGCMYRQRFN